MSRDQLYFYSNIHLPENSPGPAEAGTKSQGLPSEIHSAHFLESTLALQFTNGSKDFPKKEEWTYFRRLLALFY